MQCKKIDRWLRVQLGRSKCLIFIRPPSLRSLAVEMMWCPQHASTDVKQDGVFGLNRNALDGKILT
jgi:hypothetical protein